MKTYSPKASDVQRDWYVVDAEGLTLGRMATEVARILRPGGTLVLTDTPHDDLHDYRGFYEPYKEQWLVFDPNAFLKDAGFEAIESHDVAPPLWSRVARKPAT